MGDKYPDEYQPGDTIDVFPLGECRVIASEAAGNYHTDIGWQLTVESPLGEAVLSYTIRSLKGMVES